MKKLIAIALLSLSACVVVPAEPVVAAEDPVVYWSPGTGYYVVYQGRRWGYRGFYHHYYGPGYRVPPYPPHGYDPRFRRTVPAPPRHR